MASIPAVPSAVSSRAPWGLSAAISVALLGWTAWHYPPLTLVLVLSCVAMFWVCAWSAVCLLGERHAWLLMILGLFLGWFAEQMGSSRGWFFGRYTYTDVLGPRLGDVPLGIPLMWFALSLTGYVMASLMLWRQPVHTHPTLCSGLLTAWVAAMIITAFDLGADPYFVFVLKAWVMQKTDGGWFGETLQGFAGWMAVALTIQLAFQALAAPRRSPPPLDGRARAALAPILIYASGLVFQVMLGHPIEVRAIAFFAMGLPVLLAWAAWHQWSHPHVRVTHVRRQTEPDLTTMSLQSDPLADRVVATMVGPWAQGGALVGEGARRLSQANRLMAGWTHNGALEGDWGAAMPVDAEVLQALQSYVAQGGRHLPDWADAAKIRRAETIFIEQGPLSCTLLFCTSLPQCYVLPALAEVLHIAGQLEQHTEHRIRQTAAMVFPVMMKGGMTDPQGAGVAQVLKVRLIHATIRHLILHGDPSQVRGQVPPSAVSENPPNSMYTALAAHGWDVDVLGLPCHQVELAYTLLTFGYSFLKGMRTLGLALPAQDEEAYLHAWNVVGHVWGIRRELMAWTMDDAEALFDRMRAQAVLHPGQSDVRPPLGGALMATMARAIRIPVIRHVPVPLTRWLIGPAAAGLIGVNAQVSWVTRLLFQTGRLVIGVVDGTVRLVLPSFSLSRLFTRVLGYHLLTRFLLDQTRPLALPIQVLNPLHSTVSAWSDDPAAPGWINALEDRMTQRGDWCPAQDGRGPGTTV